MKSHRSILGLFVVLVVFGTSFSFTKALLNSAEDRMSAQGEQIHPPVGKTVSDPDFAIVEVESRAEFKHLLMLFPSVYEGHDHHWEYLSASLSSKAPLDEED